MKRLPIIAAALAIILTLGFFSSQAMCSQSKDLAGQVNINTATTEELQLLPRIGPKIAGRIIDYRTTNGPFKKIDDLKNVKGIGEKTFSRLASNIKVSGKTDLRLAQ